MKVNKIKILENLTGFLMLGVIIFAIFYFVIPIHFTVFENLGGGILSLYFPIWFMIWLILIIIIICLACIIIYFDRKERRDEIEKEG